MPQKHGQHVMFFYQCSKRFPKQKKKTHERKAHYAHKEQLQEGT